MSSSSTINRRRSPSPQQNHTAFSSPSAMLARRFQSLRPAHHSQKSETNKLIASMTMRSLVMSSGSAQIYRRSLDGNHPTPANLNQNNNNNSDSETPQTSASARGTILSSSSSSSSNAEAQVAFYGTVASLNAYNFGQVHADLLLRNPQATVLGMGSKSGSEHSSSSSFSPQQTSSNSSSSAAPSPPSNYTSPAQQVPIIAQHGVPSCLSDEIFVGSLQRRVPSVMPRLVMTAIRSVEALVGACPVPAPNYVRAEIVRRIGVLAGLLSTVKRTRTVLKGDEWDVLVSRVLHKLLAAGLSNEATDICIIFRENCSTFPENKSSLKSHLITQLASRSTVLSNDFSPPRNSSNSSGSAMSLMSPQPKYSDPASGVAIQNVPAQNLASLGVLLALSEGMPLPPMKTMPGPPQWFPGSPMAIVSGCTRILQAVQQVSVIPNKLAVNIGHVAIHEGTWSWLTQAFRETEKELFEMNGSLLSGMCCAANVLNHASQAGPQKFASSISKCLDQANEKAAQQSSSSGNHSSSSGSNNNNTSNHNSGNSSSDSSNPATTSSPASFIPSRGLASMMINTKKQQDENATTQQHPSSSSSIPPASAAVAILEVVRDPWSLSDSQLLHLRRSCSYSPSSVVAVHGRRRDAIASSVLLAVTTMKTMNCAIQLQRGFFANASKVSVFEQKVKVSFLEAICGLAMRLAGLCLTSSNHLVASLAERTSGRAVGDTRVYGSNNRGSTHNNNNKQKQQLVQDACSVSEDALGVYSPLPLLQLTCHCLFFLGSLAHQAPVADQIKPFLANSIPQLLSLKGLCEESQKLLASTFFFFIRSTPLVHPLTVLDPVILGFRVIELSLKGFSNKPEIVKALTRLDQRRNFGRMIESLQKSSEGVCNELADTFCFLKSLPKGENVLRHLPSAVSVLAQEIVENKRKSSSAAQQNDGDNTDPNRQRTPRNNTTTTSSTNAESPSTPRLFTEVTPQQITWAAQTCLSHFFSRSDSHNDLPRSTLCHFSNGSDPSIVIIAKKKRKTVCLKKSTLMASWRVLLPSTESNFDTSGDFDDADHHQSPPYPVTSWKEMSEVADLDNFGWKDDEAEDN